MRRHLRGGGGPPSEMGARCVTFSRWLEVKGFTARGCRWGAGHPPAPRWTSTVRYSATSNWSLAVAVRVVAPVAPVLACQVTSQVDVAWMGHLPAPPVRSFRERQWNLYPHGGCAFQSYPVGGGVPVPWHVNFAGGPAANVSPAVVGSPRDQSTDDNTAITVTLIPPAVTVLVRGPGLS